MEVLITSDNCPGCQKAKKNLKEELESGELEELNISQNKNEKMRGLIKERGIKTVPKVMQLPKEKVEKIKGEDDGK